MPGGKGGGKKIGTAIAGIGASFAAGRLYPSDTNSVEWSDPEDLKVQVNTYGRPIPKLFGTKRIAGHLFWVKNNQIDEVWVELQGGGGGKKGKGGKSSGGAGQGYIQRRATFGVLFCVGPGFFTRIWADTTLIIDQRADSFTAAQAAGILPRTTIHDGYTWTEYSGTETQLPDPIMESDLGVGNVPGFRGWVYMVFDDLNLEEFGNRIPNISAEITVPTTEQPDFVEVYRPGGGGGLNGDRWQPNGGITIDPHRPYLYEAQNGGIWAYDLYSISTWKYISLESVTFEINNVSYTRSITTGHQVGVDRDGSFYVGHGITITGNSGTYGIAKYNSEGVLIDQNHYEPQWGVGLDGQTVVVFDLSQYNWQRDGYPQTPNRVILQQGYWSKAVPWFDQWLVNANGEFGIENYRLANCGPGGADINGVTFTIGMGARPPLSGSGAWRFYLFSRNYSTGEPNLRCFTHASLPMYGGLSVPAEYYLEWQLTGSDLQSYVTNGLYFNSGNFIVWLEEIDKVMCVSGRNIHKINSETGVIEATYSDGTHEWRSLMGEDSISQGTIRDGVVYFARTLPLNDTTVSNVRAGGDSIGWAKFNIYSWTVEEIVQIGGSEGGNYAFEPWGKTFFSYFDAGYASTSPLGEDGNRIMLRGFPALRQTARTSVASIIDWICDKSGLEAAEYNTSLVTDDTWGYVISKVESGDKALTPLLDDFFLFETNIDGALKFSPLSLAAVIRTLTDEDYASERENPDKEWRAIDERIEEEYLLPRRVQVEFSNPDRGYDQDLAFAQRDTRTVNTQDQVSIRTPTVLTGSEAHSIALKKLRRLWTERTEVTFEISKEHSDLAPGDVVSLVHGSTTIDAVRITEQKIGVTILNQGVAFEQSDYLSEALIVQPNLNTIIAPNTETKLWLIDTHALRYAGDNDDGHYVAVSPAQNTGNWFGCILWRTVDGTTWDNVSTVPGYAGYGTVRQLISDHASLGVDYKSKLQVTMTQGEPTSVSEQQAVQGQGNIGLWKATGGEWEVLSWVESNYLGDGVWELTGLIRGRRGTEFAMDLHTAATSDFIIVDAANYSGMLRLPNQKNVTYSYYGSTVGETPVYAPTTSFTNRGRAQRPFEPWQFTVTLNGSGDLVFAWIRRSRISQGLFDGSNTGTVPLDETTESYELDIVDVNGTVLRTIVTTSQAATYTKAQQQADGAIPLDLTGKVYQISEAFGRGVPAEISIASRGAAITQTLSPIVQSATGGSPDIIAQTLSPVTQALSGTQSLTLTGTIAQTVRIVQQRAYELNPNRTGDIESVTVTPYIQVAFGLNGPAAGDIAQTTGSITQSASGTLS